MASTRKMLATGAAAALLAAAGVTGAPVTAAAAGRTVGSVFSGTVEAATRDAILVERKQRKGASALIGVDTDLDTVVSRGGQAVSLEQVPPGAEVIVSGTKTEEGTILASKIIVRIPAA